MKGVRLTNFNTSLRETLKFLEEQGELLRVEGEVDPVYQVSGIQKALENGPALLFDKIKGYPGVRDAGNIFSRRERMARIFGVSDSRKLKFKCLEAMRDPLPPKVVAEAPCQEVVVTKDIDVMATLPILKHTERDGARILGGGNTFVSGKYFRQGTHLSFNRMSFRGNDWGSVSFGSGSHLEWATYIEHRGENIPITINIGTPPAAILIAATAFLHPIVPAGADELGFAGALQGSPVEIVKAKTVDAYAIAQSEWVIEGYVNSKDRVWETEAAEKSGKSGVEPFFPEWTGYLGRAYQLLKFNVTAITHRADRPIFFSPLANGFETDNAGAPFREACFYEVADRTRPALATDVNIVTGAAGWAGNIIFQIQKRRRADDGQQRNVLAAALSAAQGLRLAIAVDEDVDIYSVDDLMWAMTTRLDPAGSIIKGTAGGMGQALMPMERIGTSQERSAQIRFEGGLALDLTVPFDAKWNFERAKHPVAQLDLKKWLSDQQIRAVQAQQSEYARLMAKRG